VSEFLILFAKVLGVAAWIISCTGLFLAGIYSEKAKHGIPLIVSAVILVILGFTLEIWWLK